jgi:hypothetical protein
VSPIRRIQWAYVVARRRGVGLSWLFYGASVAEVQSEHAGVGVALISAQDQELINAMKHRGAHADWPDVPPPYSTVWSPAWNSRTWPTSGYRSQAGAYKRADGDDFPAGDASCGQSGPCDRDIPRPRARTNAFALGADVEARAPAARGAIVGPLPR